MPHEGWQRLQMQSDASIESLSSELLSSPLSRQATIDHDPRWLVLRSDGSNGQLIAYVCRVRRELVGFAIAIYRPTTVEVRMGPLVVYRRPVGQLAFPAPPIVNGDAGESDQLALIELFLRRLRNDVTRKDVIHLAAVRDQSIVSNGISKSSPKLNGLYCQQHGNFYLHRIAKVTGDYDEYLRALGSRTRADLRATRRRLHAPNSVRMSSRCFQSESEVEDFVRDAMLVSQKTWQYLRLGAGLRDARTLTGLYRKTAALGWFRSYVLYAAEEPVAFQVGHAYRGTYYAQDIGYDPAWIGHHVGIYLHTEILIDLSHDPGIELFDFDRGDFSHKQRLSTEARRKGYFYLMPDTLHGRSLAVSMRLAHAISASVGDILERVGIRKRASRLFRSGVGG